jgi:hypothetical protein
MAGRGAQSFKKRQKEQQRKEKQQEKFAKRLERKRQGPSPATDEVVEGDGGPAPEAPSVSESEQL